MITGATLTLQFPPTAPTHRIKSVRSSMESSILLHLSILFVDEEGTIENWVQVSQHLVLNGPLMGQSSTLSTLRTTLGICHPKGMSKRSAGWSRSEPSRMWSRCHTPC